ncbi:MAG: hypothetical protein NWT08_07625 [Akkermansiaceae bacterium]|jgi:hypothetical protein|nr:hypothetical protein [Akkermansiaceae bacterium]MDP4647191.1 hypothetical protein [Akkermansiaceae bacterium]MDP4720109.1 hypothetical protein [Akkermansiaceae bacterium]MDP4780932.1 hypothetical protein [Akkermansiaceae bacterium]MDP4845755.1 hypothetical protein [Akkermansiaceae bacterium]
MKTFIAAILLLPALLCHAEDITNPRLVTVSAKLDISRDDAKRERTETTGHCVEIELRGAKSVTGELKVVTIIFAKKLPEGRLLEKESTDKITLDDQGQATVTSSTETLKYTREYDERIKTQKKGAGSKGGNKKKSTPRFKTIPASGEKYAGWAVRVYSKSGEFLGEEASASHYKLDP